MFGWFDWDMFLEDPDIKNAIPNVLLRNLKPRRYIGMRITHSERRCNNKHDIKTYLLRRIN